MSTVDVAIDDLPDSDAVPAGRYRLRIDEVSEPKSDKNDVDFVKIKFVITSGEFVNRKVSENYVPLAGRSTLKKILRASNFKGAKLASTDELIGLELEAVLGVENSEDFGEQNRIRKYLMPGEKEETKAPAMARSRPRR